MPTITVMDPVTRIEGHLKVEVTIDWQDRELQVIDARCTGTLFRGFERVLQDHVPTDAPVLTSRICGVCPVSHTLAATLALEDATGFRPPTNARVLRNLELGANYLQSHILHFYLLAALDYVQGPQAAPWTPAWDVDLRKDRRLRAMVDHLVQSIEARRLAHQMGAVFAGRMPTPHATMPGGYSAVPTAERISRFRSQLQTLTRFIERVYLPDVEALATVYNDYRAIGAGPGNLLAYGVFQLDDAGDQTLLARGAVTGGSDSVEPVATTVITEDVRHSWYDDLTDGLQPDSGQTVPQYPKNGAYSWLKSPRYAGQPYETGALARMWVNGDYRDGVSVMDRHLARGREALKVAEQMAVWVEQLDPAAPVYSDFTVPVSGNGIGLTEAPRGALGHWLEVVNGRISHYQVITPTCWNSSPRDSSYVAGPMEQALIGTPIQDPERPVEALRVIHSFDPCLSCAVHVMRPEGRPQVIRIGVVS
jgi:hydrogenase large subunit